MHLVFLKTIVMTLKNKNTKNNVTNALLSIEKIVVTFAIIAVNFGYVKINKNL